MNESISVVFAGNFQDQYPSEAQLKTFRSLYRMLFKQYNIEYVEGHGDSKATACPGIHLREALSDIFNVEDIQQFQVSRYYTPIRGQLEYYRDTYEQDFKVNCMGDCLSTASNYKLKPEDALHVVACPPYNEETGVGYKFGTKIDIDSYGEVTCVDRGGAIKGNRIDVWAGIGETGLLNLKKTRGGLLNGKVTYRP